MLVCVVICLGIVGVCREYMSSNGGACGDICLVVVAVLTNKACTCRIYLSLHRYPIFMTDVSIPSPPPPHPHPQPADAVALEDTKVCL